MKPIFKTALTASMTVAALVPTVAMAHTGHETSGLMAGLSHPFTGLDHLLAMVAVGLWAAQMGGKAIWQLPLAFIATMALGAGLSMAGMTVPFVESGILASVIAAGLLVAFAARFNLLLCTALTAAMAMFHGVAHGAEMPLAASGLGYMSGFMLATLVLHLAGIALIKAGKPALATLVARVAGGSIAAGGLVLAVM
ncbi:HupE/UreJ family protein [Oceanobacter sp. 4_MG-2023]|uniref:HupE/UreJ family protein n=1 Tax=Oceanobacter sp. 4_MG-2023 TaxID=3062623 RepID=UPI002736B677|nr:HupE/UreJ family protein [Oceanobacter sp. 4_MG-2023]MDP2546462.1 HupE/UreJ family protein [Oceanobacter sp. 4_MG-2023]